MWRSLTGSAEDAPPDTEGHPAVLVTKKNSIQVINTSISEVDQMKDPQGLTFIRSCRVLVEKIPVFEFRMVDG
jgi:hypothetical protein